MRSQENPVFFHEKGSVTASLQWPWGCYGARMGFYHPPTEFFLAFSLHSHGANNVFTMPAQCAFTACALRWWHVEDISKNNVQSPCKRQRWQQQFAQPPLCAPTEFLLRCRRPYCPAMATIRPHHCALLELCFEHAQSVHHLSAFYAITQRLLAMPQQFRRSAAWTKFGST